MTSAAIKFAWRFLGLVLLQVLICNHINFMGYINPYIYLVFILVYPAQNNTTRAKPTPVHNCKDYQRL